MRPLLIALLVSLTAISAGATEIWQSSNGQLQLQTVASGLAHPWGLAFLPNNEQLVTERDGRLRVIRDGQLAPEPVSGLPQLAVAGQGGLLDVIAHPQFEDNRLVFLSYAHRNLDGLTTRVARARFTGKALDDVDVIFEALPRSSTRRHFGSRLAFDRAGYLYISVGDRGQKDRAQNPGDDAGGVHRVTIDGEPAAGNPFLNNPERSDTFFTWGNRNIQGMTRHPETGAIWTHEHGPRGGDEINILEAGANYGWPEVTYGIGYSGLPISSKTQAPGMKDPLHFWDPSIAPSGMAFYTGDRFPEWQGDLFVGALKMQKLVRLRVRDGDVVEVEDLLTDLNERIRGVRSGPDGALWLLTDSPRGKVYRMLPRE